MGVTLDLAFDPDQPRDRRGRWSKVRLGGDWQPKIDAAKGRDLAGLPAKHTMTPGHGEFVFHSNARLQGLAAAYNRRVGLGEHPTDYSPVDATRATRVAQAFEAMKHDPSDPEVARAYGALKREVLAQYEVLDKAGYRYEFYPEGDDPYPNTPREAVFDLTQNRHMFVYPTLGKDGGFGDLAADRQDHPLLEKVPGLKWGGQEVTYNDVFRAVHDSFAHSKEGLGFRARGEDNAYRQHYAMFTRNAQKALASETRGQNTWLNYGPYGETNRTANTAETVFADQKAGILPDWAIDPDYFKRGDLDFAFDPNQPRDEQGQWTKAQVRGWLGEHPPSAKNVLAVWKKATPGERETGREWYPNANKIAKAMAKQHGVSEREAAGMIAAYSPQTPWGKNLMEANEVLRRREPIGGPGAHVNVDMNALDDVDEKHLGIMASAVNRKRALALLRGQDFEEVFGGQRNKNGSLPPHALKIRAFAELIAAGGQPPDDGTDTKVVIDRHAAGVARGLRLTEDQYAVDGPSSSYVKYAAYADAYRKAARLISKREGRTVTPEEVQATTWLTRQRLNSQMQTGVGKTRKSLGGRDDSESLNYFAQVAPDIAAVLGRPMTGYTELARPFEDDLLDLAFDPGQPRDQRGRWVDVPVRRFARIDAKIAAGKTALLKAGDNPGAFLEELAAYAKSRPTENFDLGKVRQPGTNLFTRGNKHIHRENMPQLSGEPRPGSKADALPHAPGEEVDLVDQFKKELVSKGVKVTEKRVAPESLRATQDQLVGPKVAGIMQFMATAPPSSGVFEPIFVTRDGYVIDGHHRWAANVGLDALKGRKAGSMKVREVDLSIGEALRFANDFMDEWGLPRAGMENKATVSHFAKKTDLSTSHRVKRRLIDLARVRTAAGAKKYGQPIGSVIRRDKGVLGGFPSMDAARAYVGALVGDDHPSDDEVKRFLAKRMVPTKKETFPEPPADIPTVDDLIERLNGGDGGFTGEKDINRDRPARVAGPVRRDRDDGRWPKNPKTVNINNSDISLDEAVALVGSVYQWPDMDDEGNPDPPDGGVSVHEQHRAQILSKAWAESTSIISPERRQLAASVWSEYQSPSLYGAINRMLRDDAEVDEYDIEPDQMRDIVTDMFKQGGYTTEKPVTTYRAIKSEHHDWSKSLKPGTVFSDKGIVSTTAHRRFSEGWLSGEHNGADTRKPSLKDVVVEIRVPTGTRIVGGDPQFIEMMLPPGSRFRVLSATTQEADGVNPINHGRHSFPYTHVIAELIP